jgi:catechol 2,3-dioxygenase-like lactoylglutathione lyase family enzyme
MSALKVNGLQVLAVYCSDLERSKSFYRDILGFGDEQEMPPGALLFQDGITLYLEPGRVPAEKGALKHPEICPCFGTESIKNAFQSLKDAGVKIVTEYTEYAPTFAMFRVADPDGNVIEFAGEP